MLVQDTSFLKNEIMRLKKEKDIVILAHNYEIPDVQDIADFTGDSLGLSRLAATVDQKTILFCGVHFMAETAAIISPEKKILLPSLEAGCSLSDSITVDELRNWVAIQQMLFLLVMLIRLLKLNLNLIIVVLLQML